MTPSTDDIVVLHVEDDPHFAEMAAAFLEREDDRFSVDWAEDAEAGFEQFDRRDYDCIVSDFEMPGQNGIDFLRTVRDEDDSIPFLLFTGKGSEEVASDAIAAGVTDYLQKDTGSEVYSLLANRITNAVEQYRTKLAQQETRERYRKLVENSPNAIAVQRDGIVFANEAMVELLGASDESALYGIHPKDVIHPDYHDVFEERMARVKHGDAVGGQEVRIQRLDGETRDVEVFGTSVQYGGKSAFQIVVRDITERKARVRELRRTKHAVDAAGHAIYITDPDGTIQYVNQAFEATTGYDPEEAVGRTPRILESGEMSEGYFEDLWETVRYGDSWDEIIVNRRKDGTLYRALQTIAPVHEERGGIEGYVAIQKEIDDDLRDEY